MKETGQPTALGDGTFWKRLIEIAKPLLLELVKDILSDLSAHTPRGATPGQHADDQVAQALDRALAK